MKSLKTLLLVLALFPSCSYANQYIQVAATKKKSNLRYIQKKLKSMKLNALMQQKGPYYVVYSGPFQNEKSTYYALRKVKRTFVNAKAIEVNKDSNAKQKHEGYFIGGALGYGIATVSSEVTTNPVGASVPNKTGVSYALEGGYEFENNLFATIGVAYTNMKDMTLYNYNASLNYKLYTKNGAIPFAGIIAGNSTLSWNQDPINNAVEPRDKISNSFFLAPQVGIMYNLDKHFTLYSSYQYMLLNHSTNLDTSEGTAKIKHIAVDNIKIGLQYSF